MVVDCLELNQDDYKSRAKLMALDQNLRMATVAAVGDE